MISSKPTECFLDHDQVEDFSGRFYVIVGSTHPPGAVVAYLKYEPSGTTTPWCRGSICYERVIEKYGVDHVLRAIRDRQEELYDPSLGVTVPVVKTRDILAVYRPRERLEEVLRKPRDEVETDVVEAFEIVRAGSSIDPGSIGVGGSVALGIHNPKISDIDLVVYGCREALDVAESVSRYFESVPVDIEIERLVKMSETYSLPLKILRAISAPYKRLRIPRKKREVNITFSTDSPGRYSESIVVPVALVEAEVVVQPLNCQALFYPGVATVDRVIDLRVVGLLRDVDIGWSRVVKLLNYESIYSYTLYRGGEVRVRGVLGIEKPSEDLLITIGTRETHSYAIPKKVS